MKAKINEKVGEKCYEEFLQELNNFIELYDNIPIDEMTRCEIKVIRELKEISRYIYCMY